MESKTKNSTIVNNELVWAKLRFCPYWPARVVEPPKELGKVPKHKICVFFFGSKNYGFIEKENAIEYSKNKSKFLKKCKKKDFMKAIAQIEEFIDDPNVFAPNGTISESNEITVKREHNVIVKSESDFDSMPYETETITRFGSDAYIANLQAEKEKVIQELLTVKSENQKLHFQLKHIQKEKLALNRSLLENGEKYAVDIQSLRNEMHDLNQRIKADKLKQFENTKEMSSLMRDKRLLSAQVKQLQSNACHVIKSPNKKSSTEGDSDEEYEVECIQSHQMKRGLREFYVGWKGFSKDNDCWVKEKDLNCPIILTAYLKEHNLKMAPSTSKRN